MAAMNHFQHRKFMDDMERCFSQLDKEGQEQIETPMLQLQRLFEKYQQHLASLKLVMTKYEDLRKDVRVGMRKELIRQKQRNTQLRRQYSAERRIAF